MAPLVLGRGVDFAFSGGTYAQYTDDEMIVMAFMGPERSALYPEVPTLIELGYDLVMEEYRVIAVPAGIPGRARERLIAAAEQASRSERFRRVTEDNTNFPLVFRGQEEAEDGNQRWGGRALRAASLWVARLLPVERLERAGGSTSSGVASSMYTGGGPWGRNTVTRSTMETSPTANTSPCASCRCTALANTSISVAIPPIRPARKRWFWLVCSNS